NELIPMLTSLIERLQATYRRLLAELGRMGLTADDIDEVLGDREASPEVNSCLGEITRCIGEIEGHGCHFKGLDLGLIDFPSMIDNEVAYLCWQYGETQITWWHGLEDGFAGRQPMRAGRPARGYLN